VSCCCWLRSRDGACGTVQQHGMGVLVQAWRMRELGMTRRVTESLRTAAATLEPAKWRVGLELKKTKCGGKGWDEE
jgi:hypothetical protein